MSAFSLKLYGLSSKNKIKEWEVQVVPVNQYAELIISYGEINGKKITSKKLIKTGKNTGKANETTPYQQALKEAESKINKKYDSGYTENIDELQTTVNYKPMLALNYKDRSHDIKFPCYVQPKLDGVRCLIFPHKKLFLSRMGKVFHYLEPLLHNFLKNNVKSSYVYDCELYSSELTFEEIISTVKQKNQTPDDYFLSKLKLNCFDMFDTKDASLTFQERFDIIKKTVNPINIVETYLIENESQIPSYYKKFMKEKYEGIMIRNVKGIYKNNYRSPDLQKYKEFEDKEYLIVNFKESTGKSKGQIVFICKTESGKTFSVRPKGTDAERKNMFKNGSNYIGKYLTVQYQGFTSPTSEIPRFPVGLAIRDYE